MPNNQMPAIAFDGQGRPYRVADGQYLSPIEAYSMALLGAAPGPERNALLAQRGITPQAEAGLRAFAAAHQVTPQNPSGDAGQTHGFAHDSSWDPTTGTVKKHLGSGLTQTLQSAAILGGAATGGAVYGAMTPVAAGAASGATGGAATTATDIIPGWGAPTAAGAAHGAAAGTVAGAAPSFASRIKQALTTPKGLASLAAIVPALRSLAGGGSGGGNGLGADSTGLRDEVTNSLALQRKRMEQAQPVYDALVRQAYGGMPIATRGTAPDGYVAPGDPSGAYRVDAPRFGGR